MSSNGKRKQVTTVTVSNKAPRLRNTQNVQQVSTGLTRRARRRRANRRLRRADLRAASRATQQFSSSGIRSLSALPSAVAAYINTLNNPFEYPPVKLGWGTMVPTSLYTCFGRGSFTSSSTDGSFALVLDPSIGSANAPFHIFNTTATSTASTTAGYSNATPVSAAVGEARVVSAGIKVIPMVPATSVPGVLYAGCIPGVAPNQIFGVETPTTFSTMPFLDVGYGATGASAMIHPMDPVSFQFQYATDVGQVVTGTNLWDTGVAVIAGLGFPNSTIVYYEIVLNLEATNPMGIGAQAMTSPDLRDDDGARLSSYFPSVENMWSYISRYVPKASSVAHAATEIARTVPAALNAVNQVRRLRNDYFAGQGLIQPYNRMIIEEA